MKVILITGASSGIGYTTAKLLAQQGNQVYGAARRAEKLAAIKEFGAIPVSMDVTDEASVQAAVKQVIDQAGRIDVLINNAGYGSYGPVEAVPLNEAKYQFDVNVFGVASVTKAVLPTMRQQHSGLIINISSVGGRVTSHFGDWYHASKYAVEALSDALRLELKDFGINVSIIEPGGIKSEWGGIAADHLEKAGQGTAYAAQTKKSATALRKQFNNPMMVADPSTIAKTVAKAVKSSRPKPRYLPGMVAKSMVCLHTILPTRWFDRLMLMAN